MTDPRPFFEREEMSNTQWPPFKSLAERVEYVEKQSRQAAAYELAHQMEVYAMLGMFAVGGVLLMLYAFTHG